MGEKDVGIPAWIRHKLVIKAQAYGFSERGAIERGSVLRASYISMFNCQFFFY